MAAGMVGLTASMALGADQLASWAWRVPFAVGLVIIPVGLYLRRSLPETLETPGERAGLQIIGEIWREHRRSLVLVVLAIMCLTINTYVTTYMTTYGQTALGLSARTSLLAPIVSGVVGLPVALWSGSICDRIGRKRVMLCSTAAVMLISYPSFLYLAHERSLEAFVLVVAVRVAIAAPGAVAGITVAAEIFPQHIRAAGMSTAYALAVTLFGSTTQFVIAWLIGVTGDPLSPAYYVIVTSAVGIVAMLMLPETKA